MRLSKAEQRELGLEPTPVYVPMRKTTVSHILVIPDWHPAKVNQLLGHWARANRRKAADREMVAGYALEQQIPAAACRKRVSLEITLSGPGRPPDADGFWKSTLDALVACRLLVDDSPKWCELGNVRFVRGARKCTAIMLDDITKEIPC